MARFAIDHVQIAIPAGGEALGRAFFGELLGLEELPKPPGMQGRGGCWFDLGGAQIHLGVDAGFRPARKAHVALQAPSLDEVRARLRAAGYEIHDDSPVEGRPRFFTHDPFGNRIEFVERAE
ncbi:MAG TPA: VOC family protein [Allosphingosinicella sp.]|jgi:catechol 2,3-dioxygenase-like lactoylglutathione lyase family enzyme